jgi:hypothetical protein
MRPGVPASTVAEAGRAVVDTIKDIIHFTICSPTRSASPSDLLSAEFAVVLTNHAPLQPGTSPMTLRIKGEFGIGQSQTVIVTDDGAEVLSRLPLGLTRCGLDAMAETVRIERSFRAAGPRGTTIDTLSGAVKFYFTISAPVASRGRITTHALRETGQIDRLCEAAERLRPFRPTPRNGAPAAVSSWAARLRSCRRAS